MDIRQNIEQLHDYKIDIIVIWFVSEIHIRKCWYVCCVGIGVCGCAHVGLFFGWGDGSEPVIMLTGGGEDECLEQMVNNGIIIILHSILMSINVSLPAKTVFLLPFLYHK